MLAYLHTAKLVPEKHLQCKEKVLTKKDAIHLFEVCNHEYSTSFSE